MGCNSYFYIDLKQQTLGKMQDWKNLEDFFLLPVYALYKFSVTAEHHHHKINVYLHFIPPDVDKDEQQQESGHERRRREKLMKKSFFLYTFTSIKLFNPKAFPDLFQLNANTQKLTVMSLIGNDNPKVNCLFRS